MWLTLSAHYYERYLRHRPVGCKLMVDFINFLEAGFIFQTEDQYNCIHPTSKLKRIDEEKINRLIVRTKQHQFELLVQFGCPNPHLSTWELCLFSDDQ